MTLRNIPLGIRNLELADAIQYTTVFLAVHNMGSRARGTRRRQLALPYTIPSWVGLW